MSNQLTIHNIIIIKKNRYYIYICNIYYRIYNAFGNLNYLLDINIDFNINNYNKIIIFITSYLTQNA